MINVGTKDHIATNKQIPRVLIVGGVSPSFEGAYEILKSLEDKGEVVIVHQDLPLEDEVLIPICPTGLEGFNFTPPVVEKKHQKPWYHKGRW